MRRWSVVLLAAAMPAQAQERATAFVNVSVIPMDREQVLTEQTVVVQGGRITAIGPVKEMKIPQRAVKIDGQGKFLIPGLGDMHVHLRHSPEVSPPEQTLFLYVANGVTTVRDMHSEGANSPQLMLRAQVAKGELLGPRIYTAGDPDISSPEAAATSTETLKAAGHDFVKLYGWGGDVFDSTVAAAQRVKLPVVGHVVGDVEELRLEDVLEAHWASMEHLTGYYEHMMDSRFFVRAGETGAPGWTKQGRNKWDPAKLREIAAATQRSGTWNCPTLIVFSGHPLGGQQDQNQHLEVAADWKAKAESNIDFLFQVVKELHNAGAGLILGTDTWFPGFSIHRELELLVQAGLTPYQALETGTRNIAAFFGTLDSTGTVAVGKRADLILLDGNPLQDITFTAGPAGVMVAGRWLPRAEIDARLNAIKTYVDQVNRPWDLTKVRRWNWRPRPVE